MASKTADHDYSNSENNAPEVVERSSDLIPATNPVRQDMETPQAYTSGKSYTPYDAIPNTGYSSQSGNYYPQEKDEAGLEVANTEQAARPGRRKRWIWIAIGVVLILLAIGLGVGLGVGLSSSDSDDSSQDTSQSTSSTSTSSILSTTATTTSSSTPSAVTSGTSGVAAFSCGSQQQTESTSGTEFTQECYTQYTTNRNSYYYSTDNVTTSNLGGKYTTYNLTACLDACDSYNSGGGTPACRAITYYANLSAPIEMWGANCFLKNDRGTDAHGDAVDWTKTMSAFMSCLNETCSGANV